MNTKHAHLTPTEHIPFDTLRTTLAHIFERHGTSAAVAAVLADNCASAERDGAHSHGVFRIPGYLSTLASGWVDGHAIPRVRDMAPGFLSVDACNGFAQPAYMMAYDALVAKARGTVAMGFMAARTRSTSPLLIPPSVPPERLLPRRGPDAPG